ncbi:FG-GAP repeat protein, partial [candidate division KSB1 bacterium]|nr:FG-GAP repeat protein [candidate division KSB1 bacterium]
TFILFIFLLKNLLAQVNPMPFDLTPDASFLGTHVAERIGYALSGGGDVNGDGFDDFLIGTFHNHTYGYDCGAVYLILGQYKYQNAMQTSLTLATARFTGEKRNEALGYGVANNGDINGDGLADMLMGAPAGNTSSPSPGRVYIILGRKTADWGYHAIPAFTANGCLVGELKEDRLGVSVAFVGDINSDGFDDFICGAPDNDGGAAGAGKVYFFLGKASGWNLNQLALSEARATFITGNKYAALGFSVAGVGDVNQDGIPDFLMGAPKGGVAYLIYGRQQTNWGKDFKVETSADVIFTMEGYGSGSCGYSLASAGDVNGDKIPDMVISAPEARPNGAYSGKTYLILGRANGWGSQKVNLGNVEASFTGENSFDRSGWSVSSAGDYNGDGFSEILIGMFNEENKKIISGKSYFIEGKTTGWERNQSLKQSTFLQAPSIYNLYGFCVSSAGDLNGDHWGDFLIAEPYFAKDSIGQVYVFCSNRPEHTISGKLNYYKTSYGIPGVPVSITGEFSKIDSTNPSGDFEFTLYDYSDYELSFASLLDFAPKKNCITAYDAALTARYVLGLEELNKLQKVAADVDGDNKVTPFDAALILRHSLELPRHEDTFTGDWYLSDTTLIYKNFQQDNKELLIKALVRGDVDANWKPGEFMMEKNQAQTLVTALENIKFGETFIISLMLDSISNLLAFNSELTYDPDFLELVQIQKGTQFTDFNFEYANSPNGILKIGGFGVKPVAVSGAFTNITFVMKRGKVGETNIFINNMLANDTSLPNRIFKIKTENSTTTQAQFILNQNFPNPFNATTVIEYQLSKPELIDLAIYNTLGQRIKTLVASNQEAGTYKITWEGTDIQGISVPSGVYFFKLISKEQTQMRKMILMR